MDIFGNPWAFTSMFIAWFVITLLLLINVLNENKQLRHELEVSHNYYERAINLLLEQMMETPNITEDPEW